MKKLMMAVGYHTAVGRRVAVAMMCACVCALGAFAESTDDYVQDGLVACWDGYENDGAGGHATELTEWKDTTGTYSFVFDENSGITVDGAALVFSGSTGCYATLDAAGTAATFDFAKDGTMEIVFMAADDRANTSFVLRSSKTSGIAAANYNSQTSWIVSNTSGSPKPVLDGRGEYTTLVVHYSNGVASAPYANGQPITTSGSDFWSGPQAITSLGANYNGSSPFKGEICAIRLYSTSLTPEQIAANRTVDVKRFVEGNFNSLPGVSVQGFPRYATAAGVPQYGFFPCVADETFSMSVPASFVEKGGHRIDCLGWKLYDAATGAQIMESTEQNKLKCEFTYLTPVKLVWQWNAFDMLTVRNFDDDLATVYVNDEPTTNGQKVAIDGSVKIELKDFRDDYYFRFAPETQQDRQLAFKGWEGVPTGYEGANPATFTADGDLTITPNVDVKGYCWTIQDGELQNELFRWNFKKDDSARTVTLNKCITNKLGLTANTLTLDAVQRVLYDDKLYTITAFVARPAFGDSRICQIALAPNFTTFGDTMTDGSGFVITNLIGTADLKAPTYGFYCFHYSPSQLKGPATNFVAKHTVAFLSGYSFNNRSGITGPLVLDSVRSIAANSFYGCSGLTELDCTSPYLTTIGTTAFSGCSKMGKVTIGSSVLESVASTAFPANVTNFIFLGAAPSQTVAGDIVGKMSAPAAKTTRFTVDGDRADWWALAKQPNAEEIAAGLPANCMGVFEDVSHNRKAWVVSNKPLDGILVETDMTKIENEGYTMHTGLALGDELTLTAPEGMSRCDLQHVEDGVWKTYDTQVGTSITYKHGGELTRVVWRIDGVTLNLSTTAYRGTLRVEVKSGGLVASTNIYSRGSEVWVTAVGAAERPRSRIRRWTGVPAGQETNETVKLVLNGDMNVNALFRPLEWVYDPATKTITDGEYTSGARANALIGDDGMSFAEFTCADYELWLDLAIPIYNPEDPTKDYWIAELTQNSNTTWKRVRFGPHIVSLTQSLFIRNLVLDEVEDFAKVQVESLAAYFFYNYGEGRPMMNRTYEAEDFYPPSLKKFGALAFNETAKLRGKITVGLNNLANFDSLLGRCAAVTNWIFTAEDLPTISLNTAYFAPTTVTFASTNLTAGAWLFRYGELKDLIFLAHAPSAATMNTITYAYLKNTNTVIHCSKYAPGWKELRMKGYASCPEWDARPEGCWGIYQTDNGQKRFYLVQKDSKYDKRNGFSVLVK